MGAIRFELPLGDFGSKLVTAHFTGTITSRRLKGDFDRPRFDPSGSRKIDLVRVDPLRPGLADCK